MTSTNAMGGIFAAGMIVQAAGQIANTYQSYQMAKATLEHEAYMADTAAQHESWKMAFWSKEEEVGRDILLEKQDVIVENAKAHRDLAISEAKLAEQEKTREATRVANREAVERALNKRASPFLGSPSTT